MSQIDNIYQDTKLNISPFRFDEQVVQVFEDMINRSVPGYAQILSLLPSLTKWTIDNTQGHEPALFYDLGCSLGAGMMSLDLGVQTKIAPKNYQIIGVDNSLAMLDQARTLLKGTQYQFIQADATAMKYEVAKLVLMNFTLQFIAPKAREPLLEKLYDCLETNGCLVLSEKIKPDNQAHDTVLTELHHQFKLDQGYSSLEISQKRDALENVLQAESLTTHMRRLQRIGFKQVIPWVQNFQFVSLLAIK
ncbi:MAG: carboxy-S-adenosyl-L-methionine synthase CmoA [Pseudomonadota bacterium]